MYSILLQLSDSYCFQEILDNRKRWFFSVLGQQNVDEFCFSVWLGGFVSKNYSIPDIVFFFCDILLTRNFLQLPDFSRCDLQVATVHASCVSCVCRPCRSFPEITISFCVTEYHFCSDFLQMLCLFSIYEYHCFYMPPEIIIHDLLNHLWI